jgi:thiamine monophosphate kinase
VVGGWLNVHGSTGASAHALLVAQNDAMSENHSFFLRGWGSTYVVGDWLNVHGSTGASALALFVARKTTFFNAAPPQSTKVR